jgi:four helix bundle protein
MSSSGLERLNIWVKAKKLAVDAYTKIIPLLPNEEKWGLAIQIKRSVTSISANIAEGYGRYYYQDNIRFCYNARGSLEETISHIILVSELGLIPADVKSDFIEDADILLKQINGYIAYLRKSKRAISEPQNPYSITCAEDDLELLPAEENDDL